MAEDAKAEELIDALRESFARQIREVLHELPAHQALQMADALCAVQCDVLAGLRVRYRAKQAVDSNAVIEDWRRGVPLREIMQRHNISRSAAYKLHPSRRLRAGEGG